MRKKRRLKPLRTHQVVEKIALQRSPLDPSSHKLSALGKKHVDSSLRKRNVADHDAEPRYVSEECREPGRTVRIHRTFREGSNMTHCTA